MARSLTSRILLLLFVIGLVTAGAGYAWTPTTHLAIAEYGADIAPPDLARLLEQNSEAYRQGVLEPLRPDSSVALAESGTPSEELARFIVSRTDSTVAAIVDHRPFREIAFHLGVLAHYLTELNNPLRLSDSDPGEASYREDFAAYAESARPRFAVVFYGFDPALNRTNTLAPYLRKTTTRGQQLYPFISQEYRRIGGRNGSSLFDDRSTAFGVASTCFSRAVSDIAVVLRYIWLGSGGIDIRRNLPTRSD